MPDVPERCPECGVGLQHPGTDKWMPIEEGTTAHTKERCLEHQLTAASAEAERLKADLAAAHAVIEAARCVVNNKYDVDPADVYELREAIRRYDERRGGVSR